MSSLRLCLLLALLPWILGAGGCPQMYSEAPLGDDVPVLSPETLNGSWVSPEDLLVVRVLDAQKGSLLIYRAMSLGDSTTSLQCVPPPEAASQRCKADDIPYNCVSLWRRQSIQKISNLDMYFLEAEPQPPDRRYSTGLMVLSDAKSAALAYVAVDQKTLDKRLKALVAKGTLPGRIDAKGKVVLGRLSPENYRTLLSPETGIIEWTNPFPLIKLPPELDPCKENQK